MNKKSLTKVSFGLQVLFLINLILLPIMHLFYWLALKNDPLNKMVTLKVGPLHIDAALLHNLTPILHLSVFCITTLPVLTEMYLMYLLMSLFNSMQKAKFFHLVRLRSSPVLGIPCWHCP